MTAFIPANWLEQVEVDTGKNGAELLDSDAIITTDRNEMMAQLHDRMPVILDERDQTAWLDPKNENTEALQKLLVPAPSEEMRAYRSATGEQREADRTGIILTGSRAEVGPGLARAAASTCCTGTGLHRESGDQ